MALRLPLPHAFRAKDRPRFPTVGELGSLELRGATGTRAVLVPSLGGKIAQLEIGGRSWLWSSPVIPMAPGVDGGSYIEAGDSGGYDECFPTVGACRVPGWVRAFGGIELPDHGELWSQAPQVEVITSEEGPCAMCTWTGVRAPYRFRRTVQITHRGAVRMYYDVRNDGRERLPFVWSSHPVLPLSEQTRLHVPDGSRLRHFAWHGIDFGEPRSEHRWPFIRGAGKAFDFRRPWDVAKRYACKVFVDLPEGTASIREGDRELTVRCLSGDVPYLGLWINKRGWTPFRDEEPYVNLAFEPCTGAPDTLSEALGDWNAAAWLEPEQTRRWSLEWSARTIADPEDEARV
jgi:galactose mutarotase-like enzyme